jgi:type VI secretion system secreted protein Hcp
MKLKLALVGAALALATAVTAVALGAANNSGISLDKKQLVATAAVDGVDGGDPSSPTLEISSWSWGVTNSASIGSGGGGAGSGKATLGSLTITKVIDKASPKLAFLCASGQHIPTVTLTVQRPGSSGMPYFEIKLTDALVTSVQHSGVGGDNAQPTERVTFDYRRVELKYTPVDGNAVTTRLDDAASFG